LLFIDKFRLVLFTKFQFREEEMPNECYNTITIRGSKKNPVNTFERFKDTLDYDECDRPYFSFNQTVPCPEDQQNNWFLWRNANWGTKWDATDQECELEPDYFQVSCLTAWAPPLEWAEACAKKFDLRIEVEYEEPNERFCGTAIATCDGLEDDCRELIFSDEEMEDDYENYENYNFGNGAAAA